MKNVKFRLIVMNFLEFAVWGAYLTSMGNYLGNAGMGNLIAWFYAIQGIVSIFMPAIMGIIADKLVQPQRLLGLCHLVAGLAMGCCWYLGHSSAQPDPTMFVAMYSVSVAFFMPTIALANTVAFRVLNENGLDTIKDFPPIRVFGTVGFIATMWLVNCSAVENGQFTMMLGGKTTFQYSYWQFGVSGFLSLVLALYCFVALPRLKIIKGGKAASVFEGFGSQCVCPVQDTAVCHLLYLLDVAGHVSSGNQRLCRPLYFPFPGSGRICRYLRGQEPHSAHLYLSDVRGIVYTSHPLVPAPIWHQDCDVYLNDGLDDKIWLLRAR